jgi:undecaprenyl phosphate-alpha-L-ara4N flippase subunit ArnE
MNETLTFSMLALIGFCIIAEGLCQLCFKQAANASTLAQTLTKPMVWLGIAIWGIEVVAWTNVLEHVPLSIAFPLMSLTYVTTLMAGAWVFKEQVNKRHAFGAVLITAGVACVGATGI